MRRVGVGMVFGFGLAATALAGAAPTRPTPLKRGDADAGRVVQTIQPQSLKAKLPVAGQQLLARMDDESARADAAARTLAEILARELAQAGVEVDTKALEAIAEGIAGEAASAAMALAMSITNAIAELSYIDRCDSSKDCASEPAKDGVTADGVKKMRARIAVEKTTARALLASQKAALATVTKKRARLEAAFSSLRADAGASR